MLGVFLVLCMLLVDWLSEGFKTCWESFWCFVSCLWTSLVKASKHAGSLSGALYLLVD